MNTTSTRTKDTSDIEVANLQSFFSLTGISEAGCHWLADNVQEKARCGFPIYCEHRYVHDVVEGAQEDGLTVT